MNQYIKSYFTDDIDAIKSVGEKIKGLMNTNEVYLNVQCRSNCSVEGVRIFCQTIREKQDLIGLTISKSSLLHGEWGKSLSEVLFQGNDTLEKVQLMDNDVPDDFVTLIFPGLATCTRLSKLNLSENELGGMEMKGIATILKNPNCRCRLRYLDLSHNFLSDMGMEYLAGALSCGNGSLLDLHIGGNLISPSGVVILSESLGSNCSLHLLSLEYNLVGAEGALALKRSLSENRTMKTLILGRCKLGDEGVQIIGELIRSNNSITDIFLNGNDISDQGVMKFFELVSKNETLQYINLSENMIGDQGSLTMRDFLLVNKTVCSLCIDNCEINDETAKVLSEGLAINQSLKILSMSGNSITSGDFFSFLSRNNSITYLDVSDCNISSYDLFYKYMEKNCTLQDMDGI